jgi:RND superfamily putative drug exporter
MSKCLGDFVSRYWCLVVVFWIALVAITLRNAPRWDDVTNDGDLAYMPVEMPSVRGEHLLEQAFPDDRSRSEMVLIVSREQGELTEQDQQIVQRLACRLSNLLGVNNYQASERLWQEAAQLRTANQDEQAEKVFREAHRLQIKAVNAWKDAVQFDPEFSSAWNNLGLYYRSLGIASEAAKHAQLAKDFDPSLQEAGRSLIPAVVGEARLVDVWTDQTPIFGDKLLSKDKKAQLLVARLAQEFMATENVPVLAEIERIIDQVQSAKEYPEGLRIGLTGSASVGADMLQSAAESIKNTELYTVLLVVGILVVVYRAPLLVAVPLITITVALSVATGLVAALTQLQRVPGFDWWNFKIFTTTKIFVVVILFGAGTDFCLFLISRFKEELEVPGTDNGRALAAAVSGVTGALVGSALTVIVGLAMMFFANFGKLRNSGPAIGLCLAVTLLACLTLAPALLRAMGRAVYWPFQAGVKPQSTSDSADTSTWLGKMWDAIARLIVAHPAAILILCSAAFVPLVYEGFHVKVTYDFLSELSPDRPSKIGTRAMRQHFPIGETGPLTVLAKTASRDLDSDQGKKALSDLTNRLYMDGVISVRSLSAPEGDRRRGSSLRTSAIRQHPMIRSLYLSKSDELSGDVARLDLILAHDPFSIEAIGVLNQVESLLNEESQNGQSYWADTEFVFAGTTAGIRDLRTVTRADNIRIQILVVLGVLAVLLLLLRRPVVCVFLILSVLFSYYATMGATELFFKHMYGTTFEGLDWKVPLFLFVILVAIGQDYNIYLATRVFEEQENLGLFAGLRRAIVRTGGIITSCGVIMAGTFVSMMTGSLRGIVELGFALSLGVLVDTFVVRPILVPSFLALLFRHTAAESSIGGWFKARRQREGIPAKPIRVGGPR